MDRRKYQSTTGNPNSVSGPKISGLPGRRAGQYMVSMGSPERAALGALLDDRIQPWFAEVMSDLEGTREVVLGQATRYETYYTAPR
jgi:hypothetical protein